MTTYVLPTTHERVPYQYSDTPPPVYLTITGNISAYRYNAVFEQLRIELSVSGSKYEYWSRRAVFIRRFLAWYQLDTGLVRIGVQVSITVDRKLEIVGFR